MAAFRSDLTQVEDLYVRASTYVHLFGQGTTIGRGSFEYWTAGERYYARAHADRFLGLGQNLEASFDGEEARLMLTEDNLLIRYSEFPAPIHLPFPNPLQVPFFFLRPADCPTCLGDLSQVADPEIWSSVFEGAKVKAGDLLIRGPVMEGSGPTYFSVRINDHGIATRIEWRTFEDDILARAEMRDFRDVTGLRAFPTSLTLTSFDEPGKPMAKIFYRINEIRVNTGPPDSTFQVPEERAEMVWENEERRFSKHFDAADAE